MTILENFKNQNVDDFAAWLSEHWTGDSAPWTLWFDKTYCANCESVRATVPDYHREMEFAYCELHNECKHCPGIKPWTTDGDKEVIKLWFASEV